MVQLAHNVGFSQGSNLLFWFCFIHLYFLENIGCCFALGVLFFCILGSGCNGRAALLEILSLKHLGAIFG